MTGKAATNERGRDDFNNCDLSFLTPDEGWMNCSGNLSSTIDWRGHLDSYRSTRPQRLSQRRSHNGPDYASASPKTDEGLSN